MPQMICDNWHAYGHFCAAMHSTLTVKQCIIAFVFILGNLTKHMKSKAHSKKCMDLGVSVGLIDDQDVEDYGKGFIILKNSVVYLWL